MIKKIKLSIMKPTLTFNKKYAIQHTNLSYYKAAQESIKSLPLKEKEKRKYATRLQPRVTAAIYQYKHEHMHKDIPVWKVLMGIYKKNAI